MRSAVEEVLRRVDIERPLFTGIEKLRQPAATWHPLVTSGLVRQAENAAWVDCDSCGDHAEDVVYAPGPPGAPPRPYIQCPEFGVIRVEPEHILQWSVDLGRLAGALAAALSLAGLLEELVPERLWLLGRTAAGGRTHEVFLARGLTWPDGARRIAGCPRLRAAIAPVVLVAGAIPRRDVWSGDVPTVVSLPGFVTLHGGALTADHEYLASALGGSRLTASPTPRPTFPTPPGATWPQVDIRFIDGETVSVRVTGERRTLTYAQMGMVDGRSAKPDKQWQLLRTFAANGGTLTWKSAGADRKNQKRSELLAKDLRAYFGIEGDPIVYVEKAKGWRTVFALRGEE